MEADWKRKMSLIQTRCPSVKSLKTHRTTETTLYKLREKQPSFADGGAMLNHCERDFLPFLFSFSLRDLWRALPCTTPASSMEPAALRLPLLGALRLTLLLMPASFAVESALFRVFLVQRERYAKKYDIAKCSYIIRSAKRPLQNLNHEMIEGRLMIV